MKLIIAGSRDCKVSVEEIQTLMNHYNLKPSIIVSGQARGIDTCGETWAKVNSIPIDPYPVTKEEWEQIGKSAGHKRNAKMAEVGDALLLIWDGKSSGSAGMKQLMAAKGKPIYEAIVEQITVKDKVEYVKSQGQTRNHHCHWPGCNKQVPPAQWGCSQHWFKLPNNLRNKIWATYKPGQEIDSTPSDAYLKAANEVQQWIKNNS